MTEKDLGDLSSDQELSPESLAWRTRVAFRVFYVTLQPSVFVEEFRFQKDGRNYLVSFTPPNDDQDRVIVSAGNGEYINIQSAKSQEGTDLIEYIKHERGVVSLRNSFEALEKVLDVFSQMTASENQPTRS